MEDKKITLPIIRKVVADRLGRDEDEIGGFLNALFSGITSALRSDKTVKINNLGTFSLQVMAPRKSVNISTGEAIVLEEYNKIVFEAESSLKTELNDESVEGKKLSLPTNLLKKQGKKEKIEINEEIERVNLEKGEMEIEKSQEIMIDNNEKPVESVANEELEQRELNPEMFQKLDDQATEIVSLLSEMGQPVVGGVPIVSKQDAEKTEQTNELLSEIENLKRQLEQLSTLQQTVQTSLPDQKSTILPSGMMATPKQETEVENIVPNEEPQDDNQPTEEAQESTVEQPVEPKNVENPPVQAPSEEPIDDENNQINKNINPQKHRKMSDYDNNLGYEPIEDKFEEQEEKRGMSPGVIALIVVIIFALLLVIAYFFFQDKIQAWLKPEQANVEEVISESDDFTDDFVEENEEVEDIVETTSSNSGGYDIYHRNYTEFIATERLQYGVWLAQLSRKYYNGEKDFWVFIYEANRDRIKNPNKILRGTSIRIPKLDPELMDLSNPELRKLLDELHEKYKRIH